ncbi:MAG: DNA recombination protein RmuC [Gemmatimonadetes bacterium]|nr:DNA recombination protein RmuC [Gemmatimonadota bacterium]
MSLTQVLLIALVALLLGGGFGWLLAHARTRRTAETLAGRESALAAERDRRLHLEDELGVVRAAKEEAERDLAAARERGRTAEAFVEKARTELRDSFEALAADALRGNREDFFKLADRDQTERKAALDTMLGPLKTTLEKLEHRTVEMERARESAYGNLSEQLRNLASTTATLQEKTTSLTSALRGSQTQGRWGEIALRNVVELAGMQNHVDFHEQAQVQDGKRPDVVVRLPGDRFIAVDAKVPFNAYMDAAEATTPEARNAALDRHVAAVRAHVRTLAARDYAGSIEGDVDLVVLFLPGDPFLSAAFEREPELQNEALRAKVLLATPTTLLALLRTVAIYWQQKSLAENAEKIAEVARTLYERTAVFGDHLSKVGKGLESAVDAYNKASGSFARRLIPMHRQLEEMRIAEHAAREVEAPPAVEIAPRELVERVEEEDDRIGRLF